MRHRGFNPHLHKPNEHLSLEHFPEDVRDILDEFDVDNSGSVSVDELVSAARLFRNYRNIYKRMGCILFLLLAILCVVFGVLGGTYCIIRVLFSTPLSTRAPSLLISTLSTQTLESHRHLLITQTDRHCVRRGVAHATPG